MKRILLIALIQLAVIISANNGAGFPSSAMLEKLRLTFYSAVEDEAQIELLDKYIVDNFSADESKYPPVIVAYMGGIKALMSKHAFWPFTKLSYLSESMEYFARAVKLDPENLEIRFMRFSILHHVPAILGYSEERDEDARMVFKLLMKKDYSSLSKELQQNFADFLISSERLGKTETDLLRNNIGLSYDERISSY